MYNPILRTNIYRLSLRTFDALWLIALTVYILAGIPLTPFHADESTQIFMSRDFAYQFIQRDLDRVRYSEPPVNPTEQHLRLLNGSINKYTIGLAWHISGFDLADINEQWDWGADWDYNQRTGHIPGDDLLLVSRWPSTLFLAAGGAVMFALGWALGGRLPAYLASFYYALNPVLLLNGRRAMMEGSAIFFGLLVVLLSIRFLRRPSWWMAALLGIASGLALASKHSTMFGVAAIFAASIFVLSRRASKHPAAGKPSPLKRPQIHPASTVKGGALRYLATSVLFTVAVFYLLNPAWWDNPTERIGVVLQLRQELLDIQVDVFGGYSNPMDKLAGFVRQALLALPQYYEASEWAGYIGDQIARYEASAWRGVSIGGSLPGAALLLGSMGMGVWALARDRALNAPAHGLVGVWALAVTLSTLLLTPLEWQRYYLPVYPAIGLLGALGLSHLLQRLKLCPTG